MKKPTYPESLLIGLVIDIVVTPFVAWILWRFALAPLLHVNPETPDFFAWILIAWLWRWLQPYRKEGGGVTIVTKNVQIAQEEKKDETGTS